MKRLYLYRILSIILILCLGFTLILYNNKECLVVKNETKKIVNPNYVFLGDSITEFYNLDKYYNNLPVVNSGINGNRTEDILNNLNERVYRYNPSKIILLIGVNDLLAGKTEDSIYDKIKEITDKIRKKLPSCEIYIESIYPTNNDEWKKRNKYVIDEAQMKERILNVNNKIKDLCNEKKYVYIDLYDKLKNDKDLINNEYTDDGLHPNDRGYAKITEELKKVLNL